MTTLQHQWQPSGPHVAYGLPYRDEGHDECQRCAVCGWARCEEPGQECKGRKA